MDEPFRQHPLGVLRARLLGERPRAPAVLVEDGAERRAGQRSLDGTGGPAEGRDLVREAVAVVGHDEGAALRLAGEAPAGLVDVLDLEPGVEQDHVPLGRQT